MFPILGCLIWIPIAIIALSLVQWMVAGEIDTLSGICGLFLSVGLGLLAFTAAEPWMATLAFFGTLISVIVYPLIRAVVHRRELAMVDVDDVARIYEDLQERPGNVFSQLRLAKILYSRGYAGHAITIAEQCIAQMPPNMASDDARMLKSWKRSATNPEYFRPLPCMSCGTMNQTGTIYCSRCGAPYFRDILAGKWLAGSLPRKLLAAWMAIMLVGVGIPVVVQRLPREWIAFAVPAMAVLAIVVLVIAFRSRE